MKSRRVGIGMRLYLWWTQSEVGGLNVVSLLLEVLQPKQPCWTDEGDGEGGKKVEQHTGERDDG